LQQVAGTKLLNKNICFEMYFQTMDNFRKKNVNCAYFSSKTNKFRNGKNVVHSDNRQERVNRAKQSQNSL